MMIALDAGAEDLVDEGDTWRLTSEPTDLNGRARCARERPEIAFESADLTFLRHPDRARSTRSSAAKQVLNLIDILDDLDDVDSVHANFDVPDDILQEAAAG